MILIYRFSETIPIAIDGIVSSSYKLQLPSAALSIPISPTPQLPSPGGREAVDAVVPLVPAGAAPAAWSPLFYAAPQVNRLSVVPHRRADRSCGSSTLEAHWLQPRAASVKIDLQQPQSDEVNLYVKF